MASRRFLLAQMASLAKWLPYTEYAPLYNSLVPQTIDGKSVRNRARVLSIAGNSVVMNQLIKLRATRTIWGVTVTNNDNGSITITGIPEKTGALGVITLKNVQMIIGHKYLLKGFGDGTQCNFVWNNTATTQDSYIFNANQDGSYGVYLIALDTTTNINITIFPQIIDLTQLNPFVASWSLLTPQVQKILSMGYIPQNSGEIVDSAVSGITCDANGSQIGTIQLPAPFQLGGVNTAKNTFEITDSGYVFTRNSFKITLNGSETVDNLTQYGTNFMGISNLFDNSVVPLNSSLPMFNKRVFNKGYITNLPEGYCYTYSRNFYYNIGTNDQQTNIDFITGLEMIYPLATPQVITIPRKHLGVKRIRDLSWYRSTSYTNPFFATNLLSYIKASGKCYCEAYQTINNTSGYGFGTNASNKSITIATSEGVVFIRADDCTNTTDFLAKYGDYYIFYETKDEAPDFDDRLIVEAGGTLNADSDVLADVAFAFKCR